MKKVVLFIAMSLDGFIADRNGNVDWISGHHENAESIDTYSAFIKDVDTVILGWNTYHQIITELSPTDWVYRDLMSYVITHKEQASTSKIEFTHENPCDLIRKLKQKQGKNIWICGGANIIQQLIREDLIDIYHITVIPTILGKGVRLFGTIKREIKLQLLNTQKYNGITDLVYGRR